MSWTLLDDSKELFYCGREYNCGSVKNKIVFSVRGILWVQ